MLPNFLIVGAEKAGTTTLAEMLKEHPEIFISEPKEPRFFTDLAWDKGLAWYESLFQGAETYKAVGEASPAYTWAPDPFAKETPQRIRQVLGEDVKYVYIVRHPIERIVSHCRHATAHHWIPTETSIGEAFRCNPGLKHCSRHYYQIEQYLPYTHREQWHVTSLEELIRDPQSVQQAIFKFLGVDDGVTVELKRENAGDQAARPPAFFMALTKLKSYAPSFVVRAGKRCARVLGRRVPKPELPGNLVRDLIDELKPDIRRLSDFCNKDFFRLWSISP